MKKLLFCSCLIIALVATGQSLFAQYIKTAAGTGTAGYSGDGSAAVSATLSAPFGVASDALGNIYVADEVNNVVRRVDGATGIITTFAGTGVSGFSGDGAAATAARLYNPSAVATDASGNVYISDQLNHRVRMVNISTGIISTVAGNGTGTYGGDGGPATSANLFRPYGLAFDAAGDLYIADRSNNVIRKVTLSTGIITTVAGNNTVGFSGDGASALSANLNRPLAIAFRSGNLYFADNGNNRIRMVDGSTGIINTVAGNGSGTFGGDGAAATAASLFEPSGIVFDASGNYYIADTRNNRVRMVSTSGVIATAVGYDSSGFNSDCLAPAATRLNQPTTVTFDNSGNLTICDKDNNRVRKLLQPCTGTPAAGTAVATVTDGCPYYGSTLSLLGAQLGCDLNYQWQSSTNGTTYSNVSGATSTTYFLAPGVTTYYRAIVTCVNTGLSDTSTTIYLHVNALPVIGPITGPTQVCIGDTIMLADSVTTGTWYATNTNASLSTSGRVIGLIPGIDTIIYYASNFCGTVYDSAFITINPIVTPYVAVTAFPGTAVCHGTSVVYTATLTNGGSAPAVLWYVNGLYGGTGTSFTYTPLNGDVISATLYTSAPCATTSTATGAVTMLVTGLLTPSVMITDGLLGDSVCSGYPVTFYANTVNGGTSPSYSWSVNGTVLGGASSFTYTPSNGDVVSLIATSSFTCASPASAYDTAVITVDVSEDPFVSISAFPGDTSCAGYAVTYTAFWRYGGLTPNLLWKKNGIAVATGPTYTYIPVTGDYVQCVLYSSAPCRTADSSFSNIVTMFVGPILTAYTTVSATPGTTIVAGESDTLTANVINGGSTPTYQWILNGFAVPGATNMTYISDAFVNGDSIYCVVTGSDVCATPSTFRSNTVTITVMPPNGIGSLNEEGSIALAPNPNEGDFNLVGRILTNVKEAKIEIVNMLGETIYMSTAALTQGRLNHVVKLGDNVSSGAYVIRISAGGYTKTTRFSLSK